MSDYDPHDKFHISPLLSVREKTEFPEAFWPHLNKEFENDIATIQLFIHMRQWGWEGLSADEFIACFRSMLVRTNRNGHFTLDDAKDAFNRSGR